MSHNPNKNYTQYSKFRAGEETTPIHKTEIRETEPAPDACGLNGCGADEIESASNEQPIEGQTVIPEVEPEVPADKTETEPESATEPKTLKIGRVYGCKKLNVRKQPSTSAEIVTEIVEGSEVILDVNASNALFYKISTENGIEGYCMRKYIAAQI